MEKIASVRSRNWECFFYLDSSPADLADRLSTTGIPGLLSPLHDRDKKPDGSLKKSHFHYLTCLDTAVTRSAFERIVAPLGGVMAEAKMSVVGAARYLCHLDDPKKFQYDAADVLEFNGARYNEIIAGDSSTHRQTLRKIMEFCDIHKIDNFRQLVQYLEIHDPQSAFWPVVLTPHGSAMIERYLRCAPPSSVFSRWTGAHNRRVCDASAFSADGAVPVDGAESVPLDGVSAGDDAPLVGQIAIMGFDS